MKHTMKKLLCMALAIMLLVSAVPVFAMAADGTIEFWNGATWAENTTAAGGKFPTPSASTVAAAEANAPSGKVFSGKWIAGETVYEPGVTDVAADAYIVVGPHYVNVPVTTYTVEFYDGSTWLASITVNTDGSIASGTVPTAPAKTGKTFKGWASSGLTYVPGTTVLTGNLVVGAVYEDVTTPSAPSTPTTTPHVSIILNNKTSNFDSYFDATPVNGRISSADVDTAYDRLVTPSGYRLAGWRRENVQECKELGSIDFSGLTVSINVLPVFQQISSDAAEDCGYNIDNLSKAGDVVLHVYLNNNFESEHKAYTINSIAKDGKISLMGDVKDFLTQYYTAKTSDGIEYRGMYVANGYYGVQYVNGYEIKEIGETELKCGHTELEHLRAKGRVDLNVMLMNAKAKTTATADSSNPKTGDTIFVPVMVMGLTASALAAAYVIGKKRFAR